MDPKYITLFFNEVTDFQKYQQAEIEVIDTN